MRSKIQTLAQMTAIRRRLRRSGRRLVMTNGCFDLLHPGHVEYLETAKKFGNALVVALNGDRSVRALKGNGRPIMPQRARAELLAGLAAVDYVVIFSGLRATRVMEALKPDIYVKGGDYTVDTLEASERAAVQKCGAKICLVKFKKGYSTSSIVSRIKRAG